MKIIHGKAAYLVALIAAAVAVAGATAVQAQPAGKASSDKVVDAKSQVAANSARFGFGPGQAITAKGVYTDATGRSAIRFDRTYRGLPVIGGDFIVHLTPGGAYSYGNGRKVVGLPASVQASVSAAAATSAAVAKVGYPVSGKSATKVVFTRAHSSTLAWQVNTASKSGLRGDVTYVSAGNGRTLASWPTVQTGKDVGTGKTLYSGKIKLPDTKSGKKYTLVDQTRGDQSTYDAQHSSTRGSGVLFTDKNNVWGDGTDASVESAGADAAYGVGLTWDYYLKTYGRKGIADDGKAARSYVHFGVNYVNASWSDSCFCMVFGDGSAASGIGSLVSIDVGGHEMSHGVTSRTAGLIYSGESGGLNESTSDVMGTEVEIFANNKEDVPDYVIGEEIFRSYNPATNYIRRMDKPSMDGGSKDCWYSGVGGVDVHYSSGVGNHWFYLMSEGSGAKTINGIKYDSPTCNGKKITGIGHVKAAAIWFKALTEQWVSTTNYHQAREGTLKAAKELYGKGSNEYKTSDAAWAAVGVTP